MASIEELERDWTFDQVEEAHGILDAFEEAEERAALDAEIEAERRRGRR